MQGLLERLAQGPVIGDGGFVFALEKRGYVKVQTLLNKVLSGVIIVFQGWPMDSGGTHGKSRSRYLSLFIHCIS